MDRFEQNIMEIAKGNIGEPIAVELHLTNLCNHNCIWCINRENNILSPVSQKYEHILKLIDELNNIGCLSVLISGGGDPLMYPKVLDVLKYIKSKDIDTYLITNLGMIDNHDITKMLKYTDVLRISLDSYNITSHNRVHNPRNKEIDNFNLICNNIRKIVHMNDSNTSIGISYVVDETSISGVDNFIELCKDLKVNKADLKIDNTLDKEKINCLFFKLNEKYDKLINYQNDDFQIVIDEPAIFHQYIEGNWVGLSYKCLITADGNVYPCCHCLTPENSYGNILDGFNNVWKSEKHKNIKKNYEDNNLCCSRCSEGSDAKSIVRIIDSINKFGITFD